MKPHPKISVNNKIELLVFHDFTPLLLLYPDLIKSFWIINIKCFFTIRKLNTFHLDAGLNNCHLEKLVQTMCHSKAV